MFNVSQQEWDKIFTKSKKPRLDPVWAEPVSDDLECCGCEGCGFDCGCMCS